MMGKKTRKTGIHVLGNVPWGTHFCLFYQTKEDLIDILVPYFKAGLENNEFCMWVASEPLEVEDAKRSLERVIKNLDDYIDKGQIEILDYRQWYTKSGMFEADKVLQGWVEKEDQAVKRGFNGLRLTGNTFWLGKRDWKEFADYEATINDIIGEHRMIAICTYSLEKCGAPEIIDVISSHQFALVKREGKWEIVESAERKRAERALRESEQHYRQLFEGIGDAVMVYSSQGRFLDCNEATLQRLGYSREELLRLGAAGIVHPDFHLLMKDNPKRLWAGETTVVESAHRCKDGRVIPVEVNARRIEYQGESAILAVVRDITERKRAEEALRESEERFRELVENANDIIYTHDLEGNFTSANPAATRIYGYTTEEILQLNIAQIVAPEYLPLAQQKIQGKLEGSPQTGPYELLTYNKEGELIWVEVSTRLLEEEGQPVEVEGIARDMTERKRAEEALAEERNLLRTVIDNLPDYIYVKDTESRYLISNTAHVRFLGATTPDEVVGKSVFELYPQELATLYYADDQAVILSGRRLLKREERSVDQAGNRVWLLTTKVPLRDSDGKIVGLLGIARDITERKQLEAQLRQAQKMEAVGRLAGGVAHDFNNLVTVITGFSEIMLHRHLGDHDPLREPIEEIQKAGERAASLTRQLLAFSRRQVLQPKVLDLNAVVADIDKMLRRLIGEDIELITVLNPGLRPVKADPGQVEQIIMNLTVNARDAMPQGGKLTIETANVELDEAYARLHLAVQPGPYVMLAMSDTGAGMDAETQAHIFEPFFTTKEEGTGLGLSTVYGIVKQSGGYIWVYSEPGQGTTFKIYLPQVEEAVEPLKPSAAPTRPPQGSETVLVVEDDEGVRTLAREFLQMDGYTALEARHGEEALQVCEQHEGPIHLMVTDVVMPGMSGRELAEHLAPLRPEMKVLYISGYTDNAIVRHCVLEPGTAFLQKPFTTDALARKVRLALDAPQSEQR
jgi:two-component system cell cycle sensor histidine kinase/response regulator CckA